MLQEVEAAGAVADACTTPESPLTCGDRGADGTPADAIVVSFGQNFDPVQPEPKARTASTAVSDETRSTAGPPWPWGSFWDPPVDPPAAPSRTRGSRWA